MARQIAATIDGFTPLFDVLAGGEGGLVRAAVFGKVWRYCQMRNGVCTAAQDTMADELGVTRKTVNHHIKALVAGGYLEDLSPATSKHPHTYRDTGKIAIEAKLPAVVTQSYNDVTESYNDVTESDYSSNAKLHKESKTSKETSEETRIGAFAPIITPISLDASVANATAKTDYDALARSAGIHNQSAPPRKPRKSAANITLDTADDERVKAYLRILRQDEITPTNAGYIMQRVSDLGLWVATLERWAQGDGSVSYKPTNFSGMFENYDRRVTATNTQPMARQTVSEPAGFAMLRQMMGGNNGE